MERVTARYYVVISSQGMGDARFKAPAFYPPSIVYEDFVKYARNRDWMAISSYRLDEVTKTIHDTLEDTMGADLDVYLGKYEFSAASDKKIKVKMVKTNG